MLLRKHWLVLLGVLVIAGAFRIAVAHWLANDNPDDGRVYAQIARDVVEQHVYSQDGEPPYEPTLIRTPGYPLFIAAVYSVFGHMNNGAVRILQALVDTGTCALVALLAFLWQPDEHRKVLTAIAALALAAINPFTTIYSATILPEVPTTFLAVAMCVAATLALRAERAKRRLFLWGIAGLLAGTAVLFRPDSGLFAAALGVTLVGAVVKRFLNTRGAGRPPAPFLKHVLAAGTIFTAAFVMMLAPWTVRNWRVFHLFQPLAPTHAEMPDEFIPHGYIRWLKTWLDDPQYIDPFWWELDIEPMNIDDLPDTAFDSDEERDRVAALFDQYNHPLQPQTTTANNPQPQQEPNATPQPSPIQTPNQKSAAAPAAPTPQSSPPGNANLNTEETENAGDENGQNDNNPEENNENDESGEDQSNEPNNEQHEAVKMTPQIDAAFAQIAGERIARRPLRFYVFMPAKRASALWFNTHSDFYPFEGTLLPLDELDHDTHQHIWLPLFALLVAIYTLLGIAGGFVLWTSHHPYAGIWLLLVVLVIALRLGFLSTLENPEPRYVVEFFPFLAVLGGTAVARLFKQQSELSKSTV